MPWPARLPTCHRTWAGAPGNPWRSLDETSKAGAKKGDVPSFLLPIIISKVERRSAVHALWESGGDKGPAGPSSLAAYQTCRAKRFLWPAHPLTRRHRTTAWTLHPGTLRKKPRLPADSGLANPKACRKVLAGRRPTLLLRFVGTFLLRLAERTGAAGVATGLSKSPQPERLEQESPGHRPGKK
jgi:hypothetical protein